MKVLHDALNHQEWTITTTVQNRTLRVNAAFCVPDASALQSHNALLLRRLQWPSSADAARLDFRGTLSDLLPTLRTEGRCDWKGEIVISGLTAKKKIRQCWLFGWYSGWIKKVQDSLFIQWIWSQPWEELVGASLWVLTQSSFIFECFDPVNLIFVKQNCFTKIKLVLQHVGIPVVECC